MLLLILNKLQAKTGASYLNTSHVAVNQALSFPLLLLLTDLNTSHVAVNPNQITQDTLR